MGKHFERGQTLFALKRYREAVDEFTAELHVNPNSADALSMRASSLVNLRHNRRAERDIRAALECDANHAYSFYVRSVIQGNSGLLRGAEISIREAIRLEVDVGYFHRLAEIMLAQHRRHEARAAAEQGLSLNPFHAPSLRLLANIWSLEGRSDEARQLLLNALSTDVVDPSSHQALGLLNLRVGTAQEAAAFLKEARRLSPITHNDRDLLAAAYGRIMWPFRLLDRLAMRVVYWTPARRWALLALCATVLVAVSLFAEPADPIVVALYLLAFNGLTLPFTIDTMAIAFGKVAYRKDLDIRWHQLIPEAIRLVSPIVVHGMVSFLAMMCGVGPTVAIFILGVAPSFEFLFRIVRAPSFLRKMGLFWLAAFAVFTPALLVCVAWHDHELSLVVIGWAVGMALSYFCTVWLR